MIFPGHRKHYALGTLSLVLAASVNLFGKGIPGNGASLAGLNPGMADPAAGARTAAATVPGSSPAAYLDPAASSFSAFAIVSRADEELLLYAARLNGTSLTDNLAAYPLPGGLVVPLGEMVRLLELPIQVDPRRGSASGYFLRPAQVFRLDVARGVAFVNGQEAPYPRTQVEVHEDDIYVDTRLLEQWFGLTIKRDDQAAILDLESRETLPVEARWLREGRLLRPIAKAADQYKGYQKLEDPYRFVGIPWVDQTLQLQYRSKPGSGARSFLPQGQTYLGGDLLWMSAQGYANFQNPGGLHDSRLTLGRTDPDAGLLGPMHARQFQFGDTVVPGVGLTSSSGVGSGFLVTNFNTDYQANQEKRSFVGDLAPGWQVEIYQNGSLLGFQSSRADGRYQFLDVPIQFGANDFRLVFFGPAGQRREEVIRANLLDQRTPVGNFRYRLSGVDSKNATRRGSGEFEYGLSRHWVLQASTQTLDLVGIDRKAEVTGTETYTHNYVQGGFKGYWDQAIGHLTFARDSRTSGNAFEAGSKTGFAGQVLSFSHAELRDFASEVFLPQYGPIKSRSQLSLYGSLSSLTRPWGSYQVDFRHDALERGGSYDLIGNRLSANVAGMSFSNGLTWYRFNNVASSSSNLVTGNFLASRPFGTWSLRGQANYSFNGVRKLTDVAVFMDTFAFTPLTVQAGILHNMVQGDTTYQVSMYKPTGKVSFGVNASYSRTAGLAAMLTLHMGISRDPVNRRWNMRGDGVSGYGGVAATAFQDLNGNGQREAEEPTLGATAFVVNGASLPPAQGRVFFNDHIPADQYSYVSLQPSSLEDPFAKAAVSGYKILGRPGHVAKIEVPVVALGELIGTVFLEDSGRQRPFGAIQVELVDSKGNTVRATRTAFDGMFSLDGILPGSYRLRISPPDMKRLELSGNPGKEVNLPATGGTLEGLDLVVRPLRPKASAGAGGTETFTLVDDEHASPASSPSVGPSEPSVALPVSSSGPDDPSRSSLLTHDGREVAPISVPAAKSSVPTIQEPTASINSRTDDGFTLRVADRQRHG